jgi:hypothetical protein
MLANRHPVALRRRRQGRAAAPLPAGRRAPRHDPAAAGHLAAAVVGVADTTAQARACLRAAMPPWLERGVGQYVPIAPAHGPAATRAPTSSTCSTSTRSAPRIAVIDTEGKYK